VDRKGGAVVTGVSVLVNRGAKVGRCGGGAVFVVWSALGGEVG